MDSHDEEELQKQRYSFRNFISMIETMPEISTIFNPVSDSLADRVTAFESVADAFANIQKIPVGSESDLLGEKDDVDIARKIIERSMVMASEALNNADLSEALKMGLLSNDQVKRYSVIKQQLEFEKLSLSKGQANSANQKQ